MGFNLVVWRWHPDFDSTAKRRKKKVRVADVLDGFLQDGVHPAMIEADFGEFETAVAREIAPAIIDGPYHLEKYPKARVFNMALSRVRELVEPIARIAERFGLYCAGE
jgi:hypothetical protein